MAIDYGKKGYKIALIALVFALLVLSAIGSITQSDNTKINKSGDFMTGMLYIHNRSVVTTSSEPFISFSGTNMTNGSWINLTNPINVSNVLISSNWINRIDSILLNGTRPYQLKLNITNSTGTNNATDVFLSCQTVDCNDIRFTLDQTELPYWIETKISPGVRGAVWVNVTGNGTVSLYSGVPSASNVSNGTKTFINNADVGFDSETGWTRAGAASTIIANSKMSYTFASNIGRIYSDAGVNTLSGDFIYNFEWDYKLPTAPYGVAVGISFSTTDIGFEEGDNIQIRSYPTGAQFGAVGKYGATAFYDNANPPTNGLYYGTIKRIGNVIYANLYTDAARTISVYSYSRAYTGAVGLRYVYAIREYTSTSSSATGYIDSAYVRKYSAPEPTWASWEVQNNLKTITIQPQGHPQTQIVTNTTIISVPLNLTSGVPLQNMRFYIPTPLYHIFGTAYMVPNTNVTSINYALSGTGNAYACLDSAGNVYRRATACVS